MKFYLTSDGKKVSSLLEYVGSKWEVRIEETEHEEIEWCLSYVPKQNKKLP